MPSVSQAVASVFRRQHGVITVSQAMKAGLSRDEISGRLATGHWRRFARGVYTLNGSPATFAQRVMAACLSVGHGDQDRVVAASHATARHFLLPGRGTPPPRIDLTVAVARSARSVRALGIAVHRSRHLAARDVVRVEHIPVTKPARFLADMAAVAHEADLDDLVDEILCRYPRINPTSIAGQAPKLSRSLAPWLEGPRPESVPEIALQRRLIGAGLPSPERQFVVVDPTTGSFVARVDLAYPDARLAIEYDGALTHGPRYTERDDQRRDKVSAVGWSMLTATSGDADRLTCGPFVERVRDALAIGC